MQAIDKDPFVRELVENFDAHVVDESIRPLDTGEARMMDESMRPLGQGRQTGGKRS